MRRRRWMLLPLLTVSVLTTGVPDGTARTAAGAAPGNGYLETFDGQPAAPRPFRAAGWDVTVHSRDVDTWHQLEPVDAGHGHDCGPPPATHAVSRYEDAVFSCRDHVMTAMNASGYGLIYLTPDRMVDLASGEAVVSFAVSTARSSTRDWIDLWITPYEDNLQLALVDELPDLTGPPRNAIQVTMEHDNTFRVFVYDDFRPIEIERRSVDGFETVLQPDAKRRDTFELRLSQGSLRFGMPDHDLWWVDGSLPELGWTRGVVQLGHHSYNPTKDCPVDRCGPTTWHWDDVRIEPAVPFTMISADRRYVDEGTGDAMRFSSAAPADAHLRFAGIGADLEVSFDRGASWRPAALQRQLRDPVDEAFGSYWMPIPAGTAEVRFRGAAWWGGSWMVRDASIWAPGPHDATRDATRPEAPPASSAGAGHRRAGEWLRFLVRLLSQG